MWQTLPQHGRVNAHNGRLAGLGGGQAVKAAMHGYTSLRPSILDFGCSALGEINKSLYLRSRLCTRTSSLTTVTYHSPDLEKKLLICSSCVTQRSEQTATRKNNAYKDQEYSSSVHPSNIILSTYHTSHSHNGKHQARSYANDDTCIDGISSFPSSRAN